MSNPAETSQQAVLDFLGDPVNHGGAPGVRIDTHIYRGYVVPPYYDSLLAKLITTGATRQDAIRVMQRALDEFFIEPIRTTIPLHKQIVSDPSFWRGQFSTDYLDRLLEEQA